MYTGIYHLRLEDDAAAGVEEGIGGFTFKLLALEAREADLLGGRRATDGGTTVLK